MHSVLRNMVIVADDLSGAAETATTLAGGTEHGLDVLLLTVDERPAESLHRPIVLDTDTRSADEADAAGALASVLERVPSDALLFKKVDSLLRGNVAAELAAIAAHGRIVVLAPSIPRLNRVIRNGIPSIGGVSLRATAAWRRERRPAPTSLADLLPGATAVPLAVVRDRRTLAATLRTASPGTTFACDAESDADLDAIAEAALERSGIALAGTSALAAAIARRLGIPGADSPPPHRPGNGRAVFVVGTAEPMARVQLDRLRSRGARVLAADPGDLLRRSPALFTAARDVLTAPLAVLTIAPGPAKDPGTRGVLARELAHLTAATLGDAAPELLLLTGGETARAVLTALGVRRLTVHRSISTGAALSTTDRGGIVLTRPGSFGDEDDLVRILDTVLPASPERRIS